MIRAFLRAWRDAKALADTQDELVQAARDLFVQFKANDRLLIALAEKSRELKDLHEFLETISPADLPEHQQ